MVQNLLLLKICRLADRLINTPPLFSSISYTEKNSTLYLLPDLDEGGVYADIRILNWPFRYDSPYPGTYPFRTMLGYNLFQIYLC